MLIAKDKQGNLINLLESHPGKGQYFCPTCCSAVRLKAGRIMRRHFAHISLKNCQFHHENESNEHLQLKAKLYMSLSRENETMLEHHLPEINQIADLFVNETLALEVQCSRLSEQRLRERTKAYLQADFQVRWLLGEKLWLKHRLTNLHKQFLQFSQSIGFHIWELDLRLEVLRLKYLIYEDLRGHVYYLSKTCPLSGDVLAFLKWPYQSKNLNFYKVKQDRNIRDYVRQQLRYGNQFWLRKQEKAYLSGQNLLTQELMMFFPQIQPPRVDTDFCQITNSLTSFYQNFTNYYQKNKNNLDQTLYPPVFYDKIVTKN